MKLATYKDGSRAGQLVVVSRDLSRAHYATGIAHRLQQVLDDWNFLSPQLQDLYDALNRASDGASGTGMARHAFAFDAAQCLAPLPRAFQWTNVPAYTSQLVPQPAGVAPGLLMAQGSGDSLLGPCDDVHCTNDALGLDFEPGLAVVTGDVRLGAAPAQALESIRLVMLSNVWRLRNLESEELARGFGLVQSWPASAFGPVAVTTDELGEAWAKGRLGLSLQSSCNGRKLGLCEAGPRSPVHFGDLIAHLSSTRAISAGSIIGSGAVSALDKSRGYSCIAEKRAIELTENGQAVTQYMKPGDTLRIELKGRDGQSVFGAIEQQVVSPEKPAASR